MEPEGPLPSSQQSANGRTRFLLLIMPQTKEGSFKKNTVYTINNMILIILVDKN